MKGFLRNPAVVWLAALLVSLIMRLTLGSMRWRFENVEQTRARVDPNEGAIGCFWHGRIAVAPILKRLIPDRDLQVLISQSRDGEIIAKTMEFMDMPSIRGSAGAGGKGGAAAFRQALKSLRDGGVVVITPDGPRGPTQVMHPGPVFLARTSQAPVFLFGMAASPGKTLNSWDKHRIPAPFSRGCVVIEGPLRAPRGASVAELEALRLDWETRLNAAQAQAEAILAGG